MEARREFSRLKLSPNTPRLALQLDGANDQVWMRIPGDVAASERDSHPHGCEIDFDVMTPASV
jgi:hypothetical protein